MRIVALLAAAVGLWAQGGIDRPFIGQMIDGQHLLRPVYGASGSFSVEAPSVGRVLSSACSRALCLAKTEAGLVSSGGVTLAPLGDAKIALDAAGATIYFPQIGQFGRWQNGSLTMLNLSVDGTVLSLRSAPLNLALERWGTIWIVAQEGSILDSLPADAGPVLLLPESIAYATPDALVLRKSDATELRFPAPGIIELTLLGDGYVEAVAGDILYALRTFAGREQLFQLPQPVQLPQPTTKEPELHR
jgi:hypothetical protein